MSHAKDHMSNFNLGISLTKPHLLMQGELSWWINMHSNYIKTQDYECWHIIENGDHVISKEIPKDKYTAAEYGKLEKNFKAKQLILNGLTRNDVDKVMSISTAHEMWKAIQVMHKGSDDMKNNLKFELQRDFHSFKMSDKESVSDYHSRFQILCDKMKAAEIKLDELHPSLAFIHGASERFETSKRIMLMTKEAQTMSVAELAGKFALQEKDESAYKKGQPESSGMALKLGKVLKLMESDSLPAENEDQELVLMTKMVKKFLKKKNFGSAPTTKKDIKDITCFNCQEKGHFAKDCSKPKQERPSTDGKRAFLTAWGDSDEEQENAMDQCLMGKGDSDDDESIKVTDIKPELLQRSDLVDMVNCLIDDNQTFSVHLEDLEKENKNLLNESKRLTKLLQDKEKIPINMSCINCKGKSTKSVTVTPTEEKLDIIIEKIDNLAKSIDAKTVNQTVFVKARPGLGYEDGPEHSNTASDKLVKELTEKVQFLDQALHTCKSNNDHLKEKVKVLEQEPNDGRRWFNGEPAHSIYKNQAKGQKKPVKLEKKRVCYPGRGKYGWTGDHDVCTYCGDNFHKHWSCPVKRNYRPRFDEYFDDQGNYYEGQPNHESTKEARPKLVPKSKIRQPNARRVFKYNNNQKQNVSYSYASNAYDTNFTKPNKVWIVKT